MLSADGAALADALMITALCFSAVERHGRLWERSLWMTLCTLSKQPQIVFVLLELMACRATVLRRRWSSLAFVNPTLVSRKEFRRPKISGRSGLGARLLAHYRMASLQPTGWFG